MSAIPAQVLPVADAAEAGRTERRIAIVGAGQSALVLGLGLLEHGHRVTMVSNRTAAEVVSGSVMSSQCMFESALQVEKALGLDFWTDECPPLLGLALTVAGGVAGVSPAGWAATLEWPAQSVDQRLKVSRWLDEFERRGGTLVIREATDDDVEELSRSHDLVVVATGRGALSGIFERDVEKSPYETPQRALAVTYAAGVHPRVAEPSPAVSFNLIPGVGECILVPALTTTGPCEIMVFEGIPGGPMDCWDDVRTPEQHLERSLGILETFVPWEAERFRDARLTDTGGVLTGRLVPTVRNPVGLLPSGRSVLGMADAVVLNDPVTGQGANNAAKCADLYLASILDRGDGEFSPAWMQATFDRYWRGYGQWTVAWTNALLAPLPDHVLHLLAAGAELPDLAATVANGFDDPRRLFPWWYDAAEAERLIAHKRAQAESDTFDRRGLRRALGQFVTGVTVITTRGADGRRAGVTANSFSSVSLDPPLVLWCLDKHASCRVAFAECTHFCVNVLAAGQHHVSRQFATPADDKFAGVEVVDGPAGVPLLEGVVARYLCRTVREIDAGDHMIILGQVERYDTFDREPLVFHSGFYRVATRHPELEEPPTPLP
jgi:flavin reductase (DIM6/NTAB) family NADH-FMN oxidoreductase RutF